MTEKLQVNTKTTAGVLHLQYVCGDYVCWHINQCCPEGWGPLDRKKLETLSWGVAHRMGLVIMPKLIGEPPWAVDALVTEEEFNYTIESAAKAVELLLSQQHRNFR